jgi:hypothetical protein
VDVIGGLFRIGFKPILSECLETRRLGFVSRKNIRADCVKFLDATCGCALKRAVYRPEERFLQIGLCSADSPHG